MAYTELDAKTVGDPVLKDWGNQIRTNQIDHESRINTLEGGSFSKIKIFDEIIELDRPRVGDVRYSFLTEAQFQARYGTEWTLINGASIAGTDLASLYGATLPDGRDRFPRILGGGKSIGALEANQNASHSHELRDAQGAVIYTYTGSGSGQVFPAPQPGLSVGPNLYNTQASGGSESRPDSLVLNAFVRTEDIIISQIRLVRAPYAFSFTSSIITTLLAGSAGDLEVDIKIGSTLGSLSTVFSTKPKVNYTAGNNASSSNVVFSTTNVSANDWIEVDVTATQTGQNRFHLWTIGEIS